MSKPTPDDAKRVVKAFLSELEENTTTPGIVCNYVNLTLRSDFSPTTIARYIQGAGWKRESLTGTKVVYHRPID